MFTQAPEIINGSIVLTGTFAPMQFTPDWLLANKLIGEVDFEQMKKVATGLIAPSISQLECDSFSLQVTENRIQIISKDVLRPTINDLAKGVILLLGKVTILNAGINFTSHFAMISEEQYHLVGDTLAPKAIWKKLFPNNDWSIGLTDLAVKVSFSPRSSQVTDGNGITVRVQPSAKLSNSIMLTYNNHATFAPGTSHNTEEQALQFLDSQWDDSFVRSGEIFANLLKLATEEHK